LNFYSSKYLFRLTVIIIIFVAFLAGCGKKSDAHKIRIGFSQAMTTDDWRKQMNKAMLIEASMHPEVDLLLYDGNNDIEKQINDIENLIKQKVDVIIVSPIQSKPITEVVEKAMNAGIPILIIDRKTESENYTAFVGADNIEIGRNAANYILLKANNKTARIIEIKGLSGSSPAFERSLGFNHILNQSENLELIGSIDGNWEAISIKKEFENLLKKEKNIDFVFAHNDRMAFGAWEVAKELGLEKNIQFVGVDGLNTSNGGIQLVEKGVLSATVFYPTGGNEAIKLALKIIKNEPFSKSNILNSIIIDPLNAEIIKNQLNKIDEQQESIKAQLNVIKIQDEKYYTQGNMIKILAVLLIILFGLALYSIYSAVTISRKKKELELTNQKIVIQRNQIAKHVNVIKKNNEAKFNFFTGISHEFKTPLTLILSSVESLKSDFQNKDKKLKNEVDLIFNNSKRLLRLINQLLDFKKSEDNNFRLKPSKTNIWKFSKAIFQDFKREAKKRNIDFTITTTNEDLEIYIDRNLMDKVYFNLLSNAFKFTPNNGKISISIQDAKNSDSVSICFADSGIGIPQGEIQNVFKAFYQGSNNYRNSSGIGLHLSKNFIDLHQGKIEVISKKGAEFTLTLPKGKSHLNEKDIIEEPVLNLVDEADYLESEDIILTNKLVEDKDKYTLLFIEDNIDLLEFIVKKFDDEYNVYASQGNDAIEQALKIIPDVIVCDLNLPEKNGFEICEILKKDLRTSHIPTIILTAVDNQQSYIKALESGADLYLTKPFNLKVLSQSIKGLLFNREKLKYYFKNNLDVIDDQSFGVPEQLFIKKLNEFLDANIANSDLTVEELAAFLNISRVQLYRKVKAILGINISEHINNLRLDKAAKMLKTSDLNIAEVGYASGFSSPNYFSTAFKNKYGVSPKEYKAE
jgi:ABC-type sugar transport system substrate-binding protein/AraC-like DNA-binding protein/CheY-like chemotaxis protein/nitrogen-specific signal transduction histidine kinase